MFRCISHHLQVEHGEIRDRLVINNVRVVGVIEEMSNIRICT